MAESTWVIQLSYSEPNPQRWVPVLRNGLAAAETYLSLKKQGLGAMTTTQKIKQNEEEKHHNTQEKQLSERWKIQGLPIVREAGSGRSGMGQPMLHNDRYYLGNKAIRGKK